MRQYLALIAVLLLSAAVPSQIRFRPPKPKAAPQAVKAAQDTVARGPDSTAPTVAVGDSATVAGQAPTGEQLPIADSIVVPIVDFNNQPIQDALRLLCAPYGINMSVDAGLKAKVTLRLNKVKLRDVVQFIVRENGCAYRVRNGIVQVFQPEPEPPPPPPAPPKEVQLLAVRNGKMSCDLKSCPLDSVIRWVARETGTSVITERGAKADMTAYFSDLPVDKGLRVLFQTNGFELVTKEGLTYLVPSGGGFDAESKEKETRVRYFVNIKDGLVSYNVNNAPVSGIVKEIARLANLSIYMYSDVAGTITAKVEGISIEEAFESLLRNTNGSFWYSKGIYYFGDQGMHEKKVIQIIPVNYMQADDIIGLLPSTVTGKATVKKVKEYNALLIEAPTSDIVELARTFVELIDKPIAQILIEAWVVEVKLDKLRKYGLKIFGRTGKHTPLAPSYYPGYSVEFDGESLLGFIERYITISDKAKTILVPKDFVVQLDALENEGVTNLISKPQIATLNGHAATITFGTTQYFSIEKQVVVPGATGNLVEKVQEWEKINVDMTLSVTPWVSSNNEVTMEISPNFDVPGTSPAVNVPPPINRRSLKSTVRVRNGEMIILGGLIGESEGQVIDKVPFLGDIPILSWFFSTRKIEKSKTQLMIYLIPHVYYGSENTVDPKKADPIRLLSKKEKLPEPVKKQVKKRWWK